MRQLSTGPTGRAREIRRLASATRRAAKQSSIVVLKPIPGTSNDVARTDYKSVDEYIASQPKAAQRTLEQVRRIIRKAIPGADEVISYQIPAYKLHGRTVLYFAGWKQHYSLYPFTDPLIAAFKRKLVAPIEVNNKGTIRFPLSDPVPAKLIEAVARFRAKEVVEREKARQAAAKKR
jgi:uncharacterized protein YdhG (YjbR/CyaY superfamily)